MTDTFRVACVQNCAGVDMNSNLARASDLVRRARDRGADLIATPEFFSCLDIRPEGFEIGAMPESEHPALPLFAELARATGAWLLLGSLAIKDDPRAGRARNRSFVFDSRGEIVARYDKIHMFDVDLGGGESYRESDMFAPGEEAVLVSTPWGLMGLTVCYDLRFAYLYRSLAHAGAGVLTCPAAFTRTTGQAHWHTLIRARAIETGSFVIAPCQNGRHGERESYGHSLIVDPWGEILAEGDGEEEDVVVADVELARVEEARRKVPALHHDRRYAEPRSVSVAGAKASA